MKLWESFFLRRGGRVKEFITSPVAFPPRTAEEVKMIGKTSGSIILVPIGAME